VPPPRKGEYKKDTKKIYLKIVINPKIIITSFKKEINK